MVYTTRAPPIINHALFIRVNSLPYKYLKRPFSPHLPHNNTPPTPTPPTPPPPPPPPTPPPNAPPSTNNNPPPPPKHHTPRRLTPPHPHQTPTPHHPTPHPTPPPLPPPHPPPPPPPPTHPPPPPLLLLLVGESVRAPPACTFAIRRSRRLLKECRADTLRRNLHRPPHPATSLWDWISDV